MSVRVRFAPSPTGNLHFGNLRAALFNWLFARHEGGKFLLRIEDTDRERSTPEAIRNVFESLDWSGLTIDEPAVYQTANLARHQAAAEKLIAARRAYRATSASAWSEPAAQAAAVAATPTFATFLNDFRANLAANYARHKQEFEAREAEKKPSKRRDYRPPLALAAAAEDLPALFFRLPFHIENSQFAVSSDEEIALQVHPGWPVLIHENGLEFVPRFERHSGSEPFEALAYDLQQRSLAGFPTLEALDAHGQVLYRLADDLAAIEDGAVRVLPGISVLRSRRRYVQFKDLIKGALKKPLDSLKNRLVLRSDGTPVFHLANVVDDVDMQITHILRGDDHVDNTYWHLLLFEALGCVPPLYGHLPMIVNAEGKPYSKRDGDVDVASFRDAGVLSEAFVNYLSLLGWSPGDNREKMTRAEIVAAFSLERIGDTAAQFDQAKLLNLNGQYLRELPLAALIERVRPFLAQALGVETTAALDPAWLAAFVKIEQERLTRLADIVSEKSRYFFTADAPPNLEDKRIRKIVDDPKTPGILQAMQAGLAALGSFAIGGPEGAAGQSGQSLEEIAPRCEAAIKAGAEGLGLGLKEVGPVLRVALTGGLVSPPIGELCALLGSAKIAARLAKALGK
ncbi:MAG: glutamate--tRNA ligase [Planctomycetota bacterium]